MNDLISQHLRKIILKSSSFEQMTDTLLYATLPAGKLFRPNLALHLYQDLYGVEMALEELQNIDSNISLYACALEIHHAYTLVHDDLPAMDNDDERRGKPSVHKQFGQWQAILAGDALLNLSHALLAGIKHQHIHQVSRFFSWALGAKGLILGQYYDLGGEIKKDFQSLIRTHELKTGRLIQASLLGPLFLAKTNVSYKQIKKYLRLGSHIGLTFQLLDDLSECLEQLSEHERDVSPFLHFPDESFNLLEKSLNEIQVLRLEHKNTYKYLNIYLVHMKNKMSEGLEDSSSYLVKNLGQDFVSSKLRPLMSTL